MDGNSTRTPETRQQFTTSNSLNADSEEIKKWVEFLAGQIGPRPYSNPGLLEKISRKLAGHFEKCGFSVQLQPFEFKKSLYYNVIARKKDGTGSKNRPLVVVGAHYDSVRGSPGADDNASGVAGLLEIARVLGPKAPPNLRLIAFALEEPPVFRTHNMGSYVYAKSLKKAKIPVRGMICLEMLGYYSDRPKSQNFPLFFMEKFYPDTGNFIALAGSIKSSSWTQEVKKAFKLGTDLPVESLNAPAIVIGIDLSDHWSFNRMGYPAVMVTDTAFYRNPNYHRATDLPQSLDYKRTAKAVDGVLRAVWELC